MSDNNNYNPFSFDTENENSFLPQNEEQNIEQEQSRPLQSSSIFEESEYSIYKEAQNPGVEIEQREFQVIQQSEASYSSYVPPFSPSGYSYQPETKQKKNSTRFRSTASIVALCIVISTVFGFGGSLLADKVSSSGSSNSGSSSNNPVVFQSVRKDEDETAEKMSVAAVAAATQDSVVEITTEVVSWNNRLGQMISEGAGSGVIITADGYIVTNNHVIEDASSVTVRLSDGTEYSAVIVGKDSQTDLAVLKIDAKDLQSALLGDSSKLTVGESAIAIGNPLGELGGTVTEGIISALDREITIDGETMSLLQTSAAINPGNSGGGLFNLYGELIGIVNAKSSGSDIEGLGFAIPINTAKEVIADLIEEGHVTGRVDSGLELIDINDAMTAMSYRVSNYGVYILNSSHSSLSRGDIVKAVNGQEINSSEEFNSMMKTFSVGDTVNITVSRNGEQITTSITLGEKTG